MSQFTTMRGVGCATLLQLLLALPAAPPASGVVLPDGFALQDVVVDFTDAPVGFAFLPDGRIVVIEQSSARIRLAAVGSAASVIIGTMPGVVGAGERGLLGVAVDPQWPVRPYLYFHSTNVDSTVHVTMLTASGDLADPGSTNLSLDSPYVILSGPRDRYSFHNGGTVRFGADGYLYVSIGDDGTECDAQNIHLLHGKLLRLDVSRMPGPGSGPPPRDDITPVDNPFQGSSAARLVYAFGLRNPFRFTIDPSTNNVYIGDVGTLSWEEVDEIEDSGYTGANFGWPQFEGEVDRGCCAFCSVPPFTAPIHVYPNPPDPQSASVVCGPVYGRGADPTSSFPHEYEGNLFLADFYGGWIRRLVRGGSGWTMPPAVPGQADSLYWVTGLRFITDMQVGPDGGLYLVKYISGDFVPRGVHRIVDTRTTDVQLQPAAFAVRAVPNPARVRRGTTLYFRPDLPGAVLVAIYDPAGRLVRSLSARGNASGTAHWDGRDGNGAPVPAGIYLVRLESGSGRGFQGKISLVD